MRSRINHIEKGNSFLFLGNVMMPKVDLYNEILSIIMHKSVGERNGMERNIVA